MKSISFAIIIGLLLVLQGFATKQANQGDQNKEENKQQDNKQENQDKPRTLEDELRELTAIRDKIIENISDPAQLQKIFDEQFDKIDTNGNGVLDFDEVVIALEQLAEEFGEELPDKEILKYIFNFFNKDNSEDGIDRTEFESAAFTVALEILGRLEGGIRQISDVIAEVPQQ